MRGLSRAMAIVVGVSGALAVASRVASAEAPSTWGAAPSDDNLAAAALAAPATGDAGPLADAVPRADTIPEPTSPPAAAAPPVSAGEPHEPHVHEPHDTGFNLGLRASVAVPFGLSRSDPNHMRLADQIAYAIPIGADVGYVVDPHVFIGVYLLYGFAANAGGSRASAYCNDPSLTCSANTWRFGASARWHARPKAQLDPWVGLAFGYSIMNLEADDSTGPQLSASLHGVELSALAGADFKPRSFYGLGPLVELSMGHFEGDSATAIYGYFAFGARLRTGL